MTRTGLAFRPEFAPNVADRVDSNEKFIAKTHRNPRAADSMSTSAEDLARFLTALLANKILSAKTQQQVLTPQITIPFAVQFQFGPQANAGSPEPKAVGLAYALGWGVLPHQIWPSILQRRPWRWRPELHDLTRKIPILPGPAHQLRQRRTRLAPLLEHILGATVTLWEWESYTQSAIEASRQQ
jgi:CubicO group peptidase (beta-lactamase class C family)